MTKQDDPPGTPARRAAMRLLDAVLRKGLPLEAAMASATAELDRADDRGFAHAIAAEALRRLPDLDALIDSATPKPMPDDAKPRFALRIALVQALALNTPAHAAIATVLPLVDGGPRRLVHGVFGTLIRRGDRLPDPPHLPVAVGIRWARAWGDAAAEAARYGIAQPAPIDLTLKVDDAALVAELGGVTLAPRHVRLPAGTAVEELPGYGEGRWWVQDIAASLPARLIGAAPAGGTAIDLCAAPGGKTMQLATAGWDTTAIDLSRTRLGRLMENMDRVGAKARMIVANAAVWSPDAAADVVLLDAPCSATGIFRRHPEVLHRARPRVIKELAEQQAQLLAHAATMVRPGGRLVYATCSLERSEGEEVADAFAVPGYAIDPVRVDELPHGFAPDAAGYLRVPPGTLAEAGGADGFFVARWRREA
ncbi:RsmB/NOP family class I SAM-dependent RNA methyltransferase [Sphingomonas prati]|uniref:16S rRNA (Cytosine967-C5)-methyltransferase n=1 Tax=Sphingomonas prati TaxID=1843237 RepID=A0A7W9BRS4_9SPHN|nr:RsmB/NOP family class I SAM-dependent RNA methyltransferase [Sphingomonas prati]MBB5728907.1 16S rRNA (cytosine967-C5)-methyltransferase [Sphingomonas prati]GGE86630.1 rRNA methyltransferase [Sphingomonas prati]